MNLVVDKDPAAAGPLVLEAIREVLSRKASCVLAVPGGGTPKPVFRWIAEQHDGKDVVLTWVDERHVPASHRQSNLKLAVSCGLAWDLVPMTYSGTVDEACAAYTAAFPGRVDVALLGAGEDGHIASLFPEHPALEARGVCVAIHDSPKPPAERISLTLPTLEDVDHAIVIARGRNKAEMLGRARSDPRLPLGRYRPRGEYTWVLDPAAAGAL